MTTMPQDEPTQAEMWRRLDTMQREQREQYVAINLRLDRMLTAEGLASYMGTYSTELRHVREDVDELKRDLQRGDLRLEARIDKAEAKSTSAARWAIGAVITAAGVIVGVIGLVVNVVGA